MMKMQSTAVKARSAASFANAIPVSHTFFQSRFFAVTAGGGVGAPPGTGVVGFFLNHPEIFVQFPIRRAIIANPTALQIMIVSHFIRFFLSVQCRTLCQATVLIYIIAKKTHEVKDFGCCELTTYLLIWIAPPSTQVTPVFILSAFSMLSRAISTANFACRISVVTPVAVICEVSAAASAVATVVIAFACFSAFITSASPSSSAIFFALSAFAAVSSNFDN